MNAGELLRSHNFISKGKKGCKCNPTGEYHIYHQQGDAKFTIKLYYAKKRFVISKPGRKTVNDIFPQLPTVLTEYLKG
jgi:hypothetical protein